MESSINFIKSHIFSPVCVALMIFVFVASDVYSNEPEVLAREKENAHIFRGRAFYRRNECALVDERIDTLGKAVDDFSSLSDFFNYMYLIIIEVYGDADINELTSYNRDRVIYSFLATGFKNKALEKLLSIENEDERGALATRIEDITTAHDRGEAWENYREGKRTSRPIHRVAGEIEGIKQEMEKQLTRIDRAQRVLDKALVENLEAEYIERYKADLNIQKAMLWGWEMRLEDTKKELEKIDKESEQDTAPPK